jgi:hypothetical protein
MQDAEVERSRELRKDKKEPDIYDRFPQRQKRYILAIVAFAAFLGRESCDRSERIITRRVLTLVPMPAVTSSCFLPSIPQIASDLNSSTEMIGYTVGIFVFSIGAAPLVWSTLSGFYGRRPIYIWSIPIYVASSIGVARSQSIGALIATRVLQAIGGVRRSCRLDATLADR